MQVINILFLYFINRKPFFFGLFLCFACMAIDPPEGLTREGWRALALSLATVIWFVFRSVRPAIMALFVIVLHVLLGIAEHQAVAGAIFNDSVFFVLGTLMIGAAMVRQGLDQSFARTLFNLSKRSLKKLTILMTLLSAVISSFLGEYVASALLLPFCVSVINSEKTEASKRYSAKPLLFAIGFGCIIGSVGTPSGGARNVVIMQFLREHHSSVMDYMDWTTLSYPLVILSGVGLVILLFRHFFRRSHRERVMIFESSEEIERRMTSEDKLSLLVFFTTLVLWLTSSASLGMGMIAVFGGALFLILGLVKWEDYNKIVNWGTVLLYSSLIMLGSSIYDTGVAKWISSLIIGFFGDNHLAALFLPLLVLLFMPIVSNFMGAIGAVAIFGPLFLQLACDCGVNCVAMGVFLAISSSFAYLKFTASPASTIVFTTGFLRETELRRLGWKMMLVSVIVLLMVSVIYWRFVVGSFF